MRKPMLVIAMFLSGCSGAWAQTEKSPLQGSAREVTLQGGIDTRATPITTIERGLSAQSARPLIWSTPQFDPNFDRGFSLLRRRLDAMPTPQFSAPIGNEMPRMDPMPIPELPRTWNWNTTRTDWDRAFKLPPARPGIDFPVSKSARIVDAAAAAQMEEQIRRERMFLDLGISDQIYGAYRRSSLPLGWNPVSDVSFGFKKPVPSVSPVSAKEMNAEINHAKSDAPLVPTVVEQEMNGQLSATRRDVDPDSATVLNSAERAHDAANAKAEADVKAILATMRGTPEIETIPAAPGGGSEITIAWQEWHANFARLAASKLMDAFEQNGNPGGKDAVEITVFPDRTIVVKLVEPSSGDFDGAVLDAYRSLNGDLGLTYPAGSRRTSVTFVEDVSHDDAAVSGVSSHSVKNDVERHVSR